MIAGQNWYKSNCTSNVEPKIYQDLDTLYLPVNVAYDAETKMYRYEEYRMLLPMIMIFLTEWLLNLLLRPREVQ